MLVVLNEHRKADTAYHAAESALAREMAVNEEMRDFSHAVFHDMKAPMNTVHQLLSELGNSISTRRNAQDQEDLITQSLETMERAQTQIESVMSFAGVVEGDVGPGTEVDLDELVHSVAVDLRAAFEKAGGRLQVGGLPTVRGDRSRANF